MRNDISNKCDKDVIRLVKSFIRDSNLDLSLESQLEASLSIHQYAPMIESHSSLANMSYYSIMENGTIPRWFAILYTADDEILPEEETPKNVFFKPQNPYRLLTMQQGRVFSDLPSLLDALSGLKLKFRDEKIDEHCPPLTFSIDHKYPQHMDSTSAPNTLILYGSFDQRETHELIDKILRAQNTSSVPFMFVYRHKPLSYSSSAPNMNVGGFGIDLSIRDSEYQFVDIQAKSEQDNSTPNKGDTDEEPEGDFSFFADSPINKTILGINITRLAERNRTLAGLSDDTVPLVIGTSSPLHQMYTQLVHTALSFKPALHLLKDIGPKTCDSILASPSPMLALNSLVQKFPLQLPDLVRRNFSAALEADLRHNYRTFTSLPLLNLNGRTINPQDSVFSLAAVVKEELSHAEYLHSLGLPAECVHAVAESFPHQPTTINPLFSATPTAFSPTTVRVLVRPPDEMFYLNNLEKDSMYQRFPDDPLAILASDRITPIRRNMMVGLVFADLADPTSPGVVSKLAHFAKVGLFCRIGLVPIITPGSPMEQQLVSLRMTRWWIAHSRKFGSASAANVIKTLVDERETVSIETVEQLVLNSYRFSLSTGAPATAKTWTKEAWDSMLDGGDAFVEKMLGEIARTLRQSNLPLPCLTFNGQVLPLSDVSIIPNYFQSEYHMYRSLFNSSFFDAPFPAANSFSIPRPSRSNAVLETILNASRPEIWQRRMAELGIAAPNASKELDEDQLERRLDAIRFAQMYGFVTVDRYDPTPFLTHRLPPTQPTTPFSRNITFPDLEGYSAHFVKPAALRKLISSNPSMGHTRTTNATNSTVTTVLLEDAAPLSHFVVLDPSDTTHLATLDAVLSAVSTNASRAQLLFHTTSPSSASFAATWLASIESIPHSERITFTRNLIDQFLGRSTDNQTSDFSTSTADETTFSLLRHHSQVIATLGLSVSAGSNSSLPNVFLITNGLIRPLLSPSEQLSSLDMHNFIESIAVSNPNIARPPAHLPCLNIDNAQPISAESVASTVRLVEVFDLVRSFLPVWSSLRRTADTPVSLSPDSADAVLATTLCAQIQHSYLHSRTAFDRLEFLHREALPNSATIPFRMTSSPHPPLLRLIAKIDPLRKEDRQVISQLAFLHSFFGEWTDGFVALQTTLNQASVPLRSFYLSSIPTELKFRSNGSLAAPPALVFSNVPSSFVFTVNHDTPPNWIVVQKEAVEDLDNIVFDPITDTKKNVTAVYAISTLLVSGSVNTMHWTSATGIPLYLHTPHFENGDKVGMELTNTSSLVVDHNGYFQLHADRPGLHLISLSANLQPFEKFVRLRRLGLPLGVFDGHPVGGISCEASTSFAGDVALDSRQRSAWLLMTGWDGIKLEGVVNSPLPPVSNFYAIEQAMQENIKKPKEEKPPLTFFQKVLAGFRRSPSPSSLLPTSPMTEPRRPATHSRDTIHVFTICSGHLYERLAKIMMMSVLNTTNSPVKFWFINSATSPRFRAVLPKMAERMGFEFAFMDFAWPQWLTEPTTRMRKIWAYKILFLDVMFPQDLERVIFADADQLTLANFDELMQLDLKGAPYAYTPMCDNKPEMAPYRFWESDYWKHILNGKPYHISALYVVDLPRLRVMAAGDKLRDTYQHYAQDRHSLSNLDQDLPNVLQNEVPIYSLPQEWLWCGSWCSDKTRKKAKTLDLCNNPLTKEHKLKYAQRALPEWNRYHEAILNLEMELEEDAEHLNFPTIPDTNTTTPAKPPNEPKKAEL
ncbi:putative UDP-glucose:glycoprotein glucosyltransferase [Blattamonas nauphoetae]|uniref:UDP-glucose:glycoprotein glucosyltransferase n=1 Tax=Blattamonas nauphoetae TaxID=2049346 RepID=A0ABQ9YGT9_9EUKA|nr:putative UDP-glucose:glycoprotein glucosyltransferase [Blattamonas nauphoetae]